MESLVLINISYSWSNFSTISALNGTTNWLGNRRNIAVQILTIERQLGRQNKKALLSLIAVPVANIGPFPGNYHIKR